jgi:hypothetical protein
MRHHADCTDSTVHAPEDKDSNFFGICEKGAYISVKEYW